MATEPISSSAVAAPDETPLPVTTEVQPPAPAENPSFLQRNSLRLAGILNLIGDVGLLGGGKKIRDNYKTIGGAFYTLGGLNLTLFGRVKPEEKLQQVTEGTAEFIKEKTGHLPEGSILANADTHKKSHGFFYRNAAQNTLYAYTLGAAAMLGSGIKKYRAGEGKSALFYGISSLVFKLASLLIPEKSDKEDLEKKKGGFINWIRQKPLRIFGYGSLVTDSLLGITAYKDYKRDPHNSDYRWSAVTTITYLLADFLVANSNKDPSNARGKLKADEQRRVETLAAEAIAREPVENQENLVQEVAAFLAARPETTGKAADIGQAIKNQIGRKSWVSRLETTLVSQPAR